MIYQEAIDILMNERPGCGEKVTYTEGERCEAYNIAISAIEKQIPKKPGFEFNLGDCKSRFVCECGKRIVVSHDIGLMSNHNAPEYCSNCGQKLDWSDND